MFYHAGESIYQHPPTEFPHLVSEVIALRMNEEVAGQLHSNTIAIQDAQAAHIWELEKQVDGMGLMIHKMRKRQDAMAMGLEECQHQSVMC